MKRSDRYKQTTKKSQTDTVNEPQYNTYFQPVTKTKKQKKGKGLFFKLLIPILIVLGIFMVLILLAYRPIKITWQNYEERQFIKNFERKWNQSTIKSIQESRK